MKIINGNIKNNIKLLHVNKGNADLINKISELQIIIQKHKPDIMCISEANLKGSPKSFVNHFKGYNIETNLMHEAIGVSRNLLLVKGELHYKRRKYLEQHVTCTIWIELKISDRKSIWLWGGIDNGHYPNKWTCITKRTN